MSARVTLQKNAGKAALAGKNAQKNGENDACICKPSPDRVRRLKTTKVDK